MAIDLGLLRLDDKPVDFFEALLPKKVDPRWHNVTLEHLLTMTSGHGTAHMMAADRKYLRGETGKAVSYAMKNEGLRYAFTCLMTCNPGERFVTVISRRMLPDVCLKRWSVAVYAII